MLLAVVVTLALCAAAAGVGALLHDDGPGHPDEWDERVAPLVSFVERTRGLKFRHPVAVYFLPVDQYTRAIVGTSKAESPTDEPVVPDEEASQADADVAAFQRALGFVEGPQDLDEVNERLAGDGTLAYYDFTRKLVNVRGTEVTVGVETTLVHELTHALQDQHFDLEARHQVADSEQAAVLRAVLEGDAMTVQAAYTETLTEAQRRRLDEENDTGLAEAETDLADVPTALQAAQAIPYYLGRPYVALAQTTGPGQLDPSRLDRLMGDLPDVTAAVFTPGSELEEQDDVTAPDLGDGEPFLQDTLGAFSLFVLLAERIDPLVAMSAVDGWRGDTLVAAKVAADDLDGDGPKGDVMCIAARIRMADQGESTQLVDALSIWAQAMPSEARAEVSAEGSIVDLRSCDPGEEARGSRTGGALDALVYPGGRLDLTAAFVGQGMALDRAACVAGEVVQQLSREELVASEPDPAVVDKVQQLVAAATLDC